MAVRFVVHLAALAAFVTLTACAGVIDNCAKGLEPPTDGWAHPDR